MHDFEVNFPKAYGPITASAFFRSTPEDFQVVENLGFELAGEGEHVYLHVAKCGENTAFVAEKIAQLANVKIMDVSYSGRKDRHAITRQWFSVYLPEKNLTAPIDWRKLDSETIKVLEFTRHLKKLRRGEHESNSFVIRLKNINTPDKAALDQKIQQVFDKGVPNYYGEQRFGRNANNLVDALAWIEGGRNIRDKQKQSLVLSAVRSYLFNTLLADRVSQGDWDQLIEGDPINQPSSPLWGRGRSLAKDALLTRETQLLEPFGAWLDFLEHKGLKQERRNNRLDIGVGAFRWLEENTLELTFNLAPGEFATSVLTELFDLQNQQA